MKAITAAVLASTILIIACQPVFFAARDQKAKDLLTVWAGKGRPSGNVIVVEIDDQSLSQFGRWPWPRDRLSDLLQRIHKAGADTIVLDLMFPEPDLGSPAPALLPGDSAPRSSGSPTGATDTNDERLAAAFRGGRYVIGFHLRFPPGQAGATPCAVRPLSFVLVESETPAKPAFFSASGATCSLDTLTRASAGSGFLNASPDRDGILRRVPLIAELQGSMYPSLALSAYMNYRRIDSVQLTANSSGAASLRLDGRMVPTDSKSNLLLRFRGGADTLPHVSASYLLNRDAPPSVFQNKIVVLGVSATGLRDAVATPLDPSFPGYEVQATAIDNLLQDDPLRIPREALAAELLLLLLMGLGSGFLLARLEPSWATPLVLSLVAGVWGGSALVLAKTHVVISPFPSTLVLLGNLTLLNIWRVSSEKFRWERQLNATRKFILKALTSLTNIHDVETGAHVVRVQRYSKLLCEALASHRKFRQFLTPKTIQLFYEIIPIHDIGKVSIPDSILRKPGRLTPEEYEVAKTHVTKVKEAFYDAALESGIQDEKTLRLASDIIVTHHERWDGSGYPEGLRGEEIPIAGRIVAVVDVYDALVSKRVYKEPMSHISALEYISSNRGIQFDPEVVNAFLRVQAEIHEINLACGDNLGVQTPPELQQP